MRNPILGGLVKIFAVKGFGSGVVSDSEGPIFHKNRSARQMHPIGGVFKGYARMDSPIVGTYHEFNIRE